MIIHRILTCGLAALGLVALSTGVAGAHVTVSAPDATPGGYAVLTFLVPTETPTASTVGVQIQLPTATPLASVSVEAKPGWSYVVKKVTLATPIQTDDGPVTEAIGEIDWTATAGGIKPGEFGQFAISAGPLPKQNTVTFKVIQRYSDNTSVAWVEVPATGSAAEPDHPAPTLTLTPAGAAATTAAAAASGEHDHAADASSDTRTTTALITSAIAVLLAAAGCGLGFLAWRRERP